MPPMGDCGERGRAEQFVVHLHSGYGPAHYDLMLRSGEALATWQLPRPPAGMKQGESMPARRLADHRLAYLTYEGPVSRGRGEVARHDDGSYELLEEGPDAWRIRLAGRAIRGTYHLRRSGPGPDDWMLTCELAD